MSEQEKGAARWCRRHSALPSEHPSDEDLSPGAPRIFHAALSDTPTIEYKYGEFAEITGKLGEKIN
jgi:hypothetical protein